MLRTGTVAVVFLFALFVSRALADCEYAYSLNLVEHYYLNLDEVALGFASYYDSTANRTVKFTICDTVYDWISDTTNSTGWFYGGFASLGDTGDFDTSGTPTTLIMNFWGGDKGYWDGVNCGLWGGRSAEVRITKTGACAPMNGSVVCISSIDYSQKQYCKLIINAAFDYGSSKNTVNIYPYIAIAVIIFLVFTLVIILLTVGFLYQFVLMERRNLDLIPLVGEIKHFVFGKPLTGAPEDEIASTVPATTASI